MKNKIPIIGLVLGLFMLIFYPAYDFYYTYKNTEKIKQLDDTTSKVSIDNVDQYFNEANLYNKKLAGEVIQKQLKPYDKQLNISGKNTAFASLIIPSLNIKMPIYHGTDESALAQGVGHLKETSLPIGGPSTHTCLSAHSGMKEMRAFDDIRNLKNGDVFGIKTLGRLFTYKVYKTEVVLPHKMHSLLIKKNEDLATLITCTPYGVNTHRLLVHAKRCPIPNNFEKNKEVIKNVINNKRYLPAIIAICLLFLLIVFQIIKKILKKRRKKYEFQKKNK